MLWKRPQMLEALVCLQTRSMNVTRQLSLRSLMLTHEEYIKEQSSLSVLQISYGFLLHSNFMARCLHVIWTCWKGIKKWQSGSCLFTLRWELEVCTGIEILWGPAKNAGGGGFYFLLLLSENKETTFINIGVYWMCWITQIAPHATLAISIYSSSVIVLSGFVMPLGVGMGFVRLSAREGRIGQNCFRCGWHWSDLLSEPVGFFRITPQVGGVDQNFFTNKRDWSDFLGRAWYWLEFLQD